MAIDTIEQFKSALLFDFDFILKKVMLMPHVQKEIIELNQIEQLNEGIDAQDKKIRTIAAIEQNSGNVYSENTIREKNKKGQDSKNVTLKDTGSFWKTFKVISKGKDWQIVANFNVHGEDITDNFQIDEFDFLGLTNENLDFFVFNTLLPQAEIELRKLKKI